MGPRHRRRRGAVRLSPRADGHDHLRQGATAEHADLLGDLAGWAHAMLEAGADSVEVRQARVPRLHSDHRLRAFVYASDQVADRLASLDAAAMGVPDASYLAGTALTFTGQDVVIVRT